MDLIALLQKLGILGVGGTAATYPGLCTRQVRPGCEACGAKLYGHTANPAEQSRRVGIVAPWVNMDKNRIFMIISASYCSAANNNTFIHVDE